METPIKNNTDLLSDYMSYIQDDITIKKTPIGFEKLDNMLDGGLPKGLITLGAITSIGKTTFMNQVADNMASMENTKVLFFSLEMSKYDLLTKSLSRLTYKDEDLQQLTYDELLSNNEAIDYAPILEKYKQIANNLYIVDDLYDYRDIKSCISQFKDANQEANIIIIIDYLQYICLNGNGNDKQVIDFITKSLKELSKSMGITVIVISSLNRANYGNSITLESFKESGSIEYTSDLLIGLEYTNNNTNDRDYEAKKNPRKLTLNIIKNRYGSLGKVNYEFYPKYNTFKEL